MIPVTVRRINLSRKVAPCPRCGTPSRRHSVQTRKIREIGVSGPVRLEVHFSKHHCRDCQWIFSMPMEEIAPPKGRFTHRVRRLAVNMFRAGAMTLDQAGRRMQERYFVHVPPTTLHDWVAASHKDSP